MRQDGLLSQWDDDKGYGFIAPKNGEARLFVHVKDFSLRVGRPQVGESLTFLVGQDHNGKRRAVQVRGLALPVLARAGRPAAAVSPLWLIPGFAAFYLLCHLLWPMPPALWGGYMAMSLATFIVYAGDKRAARLGQWRVAETTLHGLALACGWPGALLAQHLLRHKTGKVQFRRRFWLTVAGNVVLFVLLFTPLRQWLAAGLLAG
jgi:uncharacterized membrane protein YsdA (DUF1294 family)/cold shock CspA family protein